jgi:histone H3/H4
MIKNNKMNNTLIKRKNLLVLIKKAGIKRVSKDALVSLEDYFKEELGILLNALKEEITIQGRKTLEKKDIQNTIKYLNKKEKFFEI